MEKKKKKSSKNPQNPDPKRLQEYALPILKRHFWFPEKLATAHMALFARWQAALHAEYQLENLQKQLLQLSRSLGNRVTHAHVLVSHCHWGAVQGRSPLPEPRSSLGNPRGTRGRPAAPAIPTALSAPSSNWENPQFTVFNMRALAQSKYHCNTKSNMN